MAEERLIEYPQRESVSDLVFRFTIYIKGGIETFNPLKLLPKIVLPKPSTSGEGA
jgi:hypothetical protein